METIGQKLKKLIESKGVTAYEVSVATKISEATISRIINKNTKPNLTNRKILSEYFNVPESYFLDVEVGSFSPVDQDDGLCDETRTPDLRKVGAFVIKNMDRMRKEVPEFDTYCENMEMKAVIKEFKALKLHS